MNLRRPRILHDVLVMVAFNLCATGSVQAQDQLGDGRLFLSAEHRARLDRLRDNPVKEVVPQPVEVPKPKPVVKKVVKPKPKLPMPEVKLQGFVMRSGGENTVWINDRATKEGERTRQDLQLLSMDGDTNDVQIQMPDQSQIKLKPGQEFQPNGRKIIDLGE